MSPPPPPSGEGGKLQVLAKVVVVADTVDLSPIALATENLKIVDRVPAPSCMGNDVIDFQVVPRATQRTGLVRFGEDLLPDFRGNGAAFSLRISVSTSSIAHTCLTEPEGHQAAQPRQQQPVQITL